MYDPVDPRCVNTRVSCPRVRVITRCVRCPGQEVLADPAKGVRCGVAIHHSVDFQSVAHDLNYALGAAQGRPRTPGPCAGGLYEPGCQVESPSRSDPLIFKLSTTSMRSRKPSPSTDVASCRPAWAHERSPQSQVGMVASESASPRCRTTAAPTPAAAGRVHSATSTVAARRSPALIVRSTPDARAIVAIQPSPAAPILDVLTGRPAATSFRLLPSHVITGTTLPACPRSPGQRLAIVRAGESDDGKYRPSEDWRSGNACLGVSRGHATRPARRSQRDGATRPTRIRASGTQYPSRCSRSTGPVDASLIAGPGPFSQCPVRTTRVAAMSSGEMKRSVPSRSTGR